ncbi:MAG: hypothetical protein ACLFPW_13975 [Spirochaetaceae bacterium]
MKQGRAALLLLVVIFAAAIFAPVLSPRDPTAQRLDSALAVSGSPRHSSAEGVRRSLWG